jgi:hypothetical protein
MDREKNSMRSKEYRSDWFYKLVGFSENRVNDVRDHLRIASDRLVSNVNQASFRFGKLEIVSLEQLREQVAATGMRAGQIKVSEVVGDSRALHVDTANANAVFQVASQFNLLEMVSPNAIPEDGVGIYEYDPTQGPACAIACGAGTIYRNYFVELDGQFGQSETRQVDCLAGIGQALGNTNNRLWRMVNGYALPSEAGLKEISQRIKSSSAIQIDELRARLQIGVQWDTQVTLEDCTHSVSQAYCSAVPVAYSGLDATLWEPFARLVLEATYEATFAVATLNAMKTGNSLLYLTLVGGGAFGNQPAWILDAIRRAVNLYNASGLDLQIVSYRQSNTHVRELCEELSR